MTEQQTLQSAKSQNNGSARENSSKRRSKPTHYIQNRPITMLKGEQVYLAPFKHNAIHNEQKYARKDCFCFNYDPIWQEDQVVIRCDWLELFLSYKVMPRPYAEKDCCTAKVRLITDPKLSIFQLKC